MCCDDVDADGDGDVPLTTLSKTVYMLLLTAVCPGRERMLLYVRAADGDSFTDEDHGRDVLEALCKTDRPTEDRPTYRQTYRLANRWAHSHTHTHARTRARTHTHVRGDRRHIHKHRQTDMQTHTQRHTLTDRPTDRPTDIHTDRLAHWPTGRHTHTCARAWACTHA